MDGWLKGLIAAACCVVIAGGCYFAFNQYRAWQASQAYAETDRLVRAELFDLAGAKPDDIAGVRGYCKRMGERLLDDLKDNSEARRISKNCRALGYSY